MLSGIELEPAGDAVGALIWLHGRGASGQDLAGAVPMLGLRGVRVVLPDAPVRDGWRSWFDVRFDAPPRWREEADQVDAVAGEVAALIAREAERGIAPERVVLAGFSQGAALALHTGLRHPETLAGIAALAGYLPLPERVAQAHAANAATALFISHGTEDDVVPPSYGRAAFAELRAGRDAVWAPYPIGHELSGDQLEDFGRWITSRLVDDHAAPRTERTDPMRVFWVPAGLAGRIGLTWAPGKEGLASYGRPWSRRLGADLDALRAEGVDLLACLLPDDELRALGIADLVDEAQARGIAVVRLPIGDFGVPDLGQARALVRRMVDHATGSGVAVVHCRGGYGRSGTIAACCLVEQGMAADAAIAAVRRARPGAIENDDQVRFVRNYRRARTAIQGAVRRPGSVS